MRRAGVVMLVLAAALAGPLRQACGATCRDSAEVAPTAVAEALVDQPSCHGPEPEPQSKQLPGSERCTHDHTGSLRPAERAVLADVTFVPVILDAPGVHQPVLMTLPAPPAFDDLSPGSPPIRILTLRI